MTLAAAVIYSDLLMTWLGVFPCVFCVVILFQQLRDILKYPLHTVHSPVALTHPYILQIDPFHLGTAAQRYVFKKVAGNIPRIYFGAYKGGDVTELPAHPWPVHHIPKMFYWKLGDCWVQQWARFHGQEASLRWLELRDTAHGTFYQLDPVW